MTAICAVFVSLRLFITLVLLLVICLFVAFKTFATRRHASHNYAQRENRIPVPLGKSQGQIKLN